MCRRTEKNSEVSQTSKLELLKKIVKMSKEIPRKLTCGNSFCKVAASKALISMQQDSTREEIWRRKLMQKSAFKVKKENPSWMLSKTCRLVKIDFKVEWNYVEKLHRNESTLAKRLSFLEYWKLINTGQSDHDFFSFKNTSKEAPWIQNVH